MKLEFSSDRNRVRLWDKFDQAQAAVRAPINGAPDPAPPSVPVVVTPVRPAGLGAAPVQRTIYQAPTPIRYISEPERTQWGEYRTALLVFVVIVFAALILVPVLMPEGNPWGRFHKDLLPKKAKQAEPPIVSGARPPAMPATVSRKPDPLIDGWSLELLNEIEWHRFEQVVAAYEKELGHDARLTDFGADGGIDIKVYDREAGQVKRLVQCKAYSQKLKVDLVRAFYGVMAHENVKEGTYYTTDRYTADALQFAEGKNLELIDGPTFLSRIKKLDLPIQLRLFETATKGDYKTPTCASCGIKMRLVSGKNDRSFWGCPNYPRCNNRLSFVKE
ncbi:MAG: restriction endonuclease [Opitutales bacterium]|nr:restriction endonuclease [Opitutales bacterium]